MDDRLAAAEEVDRFFCGGDFFVGFCAFHGEDFAAFFSEREAPLGDPDQLADGASDDGVE